MKPLVLEANLENKVTNKGHIFQPDSTLRNLFNPKTTLGEGTHKIVNRCYAWMTQKTKPQVSYLAIV